MKSRLFLLVALLVSLVSIGHAEPKAYDLVKYSGKAAGATIYFDFADGYSEASTLKVAEPGSSKRTNYMMENSNTMLFLPEKDAKSGKSITLNFDMESRAPSKVTGTYTSGGKTTPFTLTKSKK
jgi:hypothetical protein